MYQSGPEGGTVSQHNVTDTTIQQITQYHNHNKEQQQPTTAEDVACRQHKPTICTAGLAAAAAAV
jgi:hypothetical protein